MFPPVCPTPQTPCLLLQGQLASPWACTLLPIPQQAPTTPSTRHKACVGLRSSSGGSQCSLQCPFRTWGLAFFPALTKHLPKSDMPHPFTSGSASPLVRMAGQLSCKSRSTSHWRCIPERLSLARSPLPLQARTLRAFVARQGHLLCLYRPSSSWACCTPQSELFPESHNVLDTLLMGVGGERLVCVKEHCGRVREGPPWEENGVAGVAGRRQEKGQGEQVCSQGKPG